MGTSVGTKRLIAAALAALIGILSSNPKTAAFAPYVSYLASGIGLLGLVHAVKAGTLAKYKLGSITAVLQVLTQAAKNIPQLAPLVALLELITSLFGGVTLATHAATNTPASGN